MRTLLQASFLMGTLWLFGCSGMPSGEEQNREARRQYEADKKAEEFAKSLPPAR